MEDFESFHRTCEPSSHGHGKELVYDETYRLARELRPNRFGLNFDPLEFTNQVLDTIGILCSMPIGITLYKLNSYTTKGFFRPHKDTPKAGNHVGTLVIALPTDFEGGESILRHKQHEAKFDWSNQKQKQNPGALSWVFFYSNIEHEILPVTSGHRLTLSYDVYRKPGEMHYRPEIQPIRVLDAHTLPLSSSLRSSISDPHFLANGGRLAIGLEHEYPLKSKQWSTNFIEFLKGTDAAFMRVFEEMRISYEVVAVHEVDVYSNRDYSSNEPNRRPALRLVGPRSSVEDGMALLTGTVYQV